MSNASYQVTTVFVDADNTLWNTDTVFADAQLKLLAAVEILVKHTVSKNDRLAFVRSVDQAIAVRHHHGLKYPVAVLIRSLAAILSGEAAPRAVRMSIDGGHLEGSPDGEEIRQIEMAYLDALAALPILRAGVIEGLEELRGIAGTRVVVITEGGRARVQNIAARLGVAKYIDRVLEGTKRPELYQRVLRLLGSPIKSFMVGDQLDRDIAPARAAGLKTVYFPGGFRPNWGPEVSEVRPDHIIRSFAEVPGIILGRHQSPPPITLPDSQQQRDG